MNSYLDWSDKGRAGGWRYLLGSVVLFILIFVVAGLEDVPANFIFKNSQDSVAVALLGTAFAFTIAFFAVLLVVRFLHQRPFWSVAMPSWGFWKWDFWISFLIGSIVFFLTQLVFTVIGLIQIESNPDFSMLSLALVALIGFVGIFFQAGAEELLFRGYLTQFARRFTGNRFLFIGIPAIIFASPHIFNIFELDGGILLILPFLILGLVLGWAAYRSGTLWMALGLHLSNNYLSVVLMGTKGDVLPSAAPMLIDLPSLWVIVVVAAIQAVLLVAILEFLMRRRESRS